MGMQYVCASDFASSRKLSSQTLEDLAIIPYPNGTQSSLEQILNSCKTSAGRKYFSQSLQQCATDIAMLRERQAQVVALAQKPAVIAKAEDALMSCARYEPEFGHLCSHTYDRFYANRESMLLRHIAHGLGKDAGTIVSRINGSEVALTASCWQQYLQILGPTLVHILGFYSTGSDCAHQHHTGHSNVAKHECNGSSGGKGLVVLRFYFLYEILAHVFSWNALKNDWMDTNNSIALMQQEICSYKAYLTQARMLYDVLKGDNKYLIQKHAPLLEHLFGESQKPDTMREHVRMLMNSDWDVAQKRWFNPGSVLVAYKQLNVHREMYETVCKQIGILDAYVRVAKLLTIGQNAPYCAVSFVDSVEPSLQVTGLRHHAIAQGQMRPMDVSLSGDQRLLVIKGGNGSGKSTMLTALGQAIALSQWGIAPARACTCTPFHTIYSRSVNRDNIETGKSHFYYENANHRAMLEEIANQKKPTLVLLDEPYSCTNQEAGIKHLITLLQALAQEKYAVSIVATHLPVDQIDSPVLTLAS